MNKMKKVVGERGNIKYEKEGILGKLHNFVYPPESRYFWYRRGEIQRTKLSFKYAKLLVLTLIVGCAGSGAAMFGFVFVISVMMREWFHIKHGQNSILLPILLDQGANFTSSEVYSNASHSAELALHSNFEEQYMKDLVSDPYFIITWMMIGGTFTLLAYWFGASIIHNEYYIKQRDKANEWKIQQKFLTDELFLEEKRTGLFNGFMAGFAGMGLFFYHQNYPFLKFQYTMENGWKGFFAQCLLVYIWVDFYSYWMHRLLHHRWIYKYVHKWHHRYKQPTAYGAFAIHPLEYLGFQTAGIWCAAVFPVHIMAFLSVVTYVAYHNQVDHSGVYFEGELPWVPSTAFHDNHHQFFHLNFGVTLIIWDYLFGTLRQRDRKYAEDIFVGSQDKKTQ